MPGISRKTRASPGKIAADRHFFSFDVLSAEFDTSSVPSALSIALRYISVFSPWKILDEDAVEIGLACLRRQVRRPPRLFGAEIDCTSELQLILELINHLLDGPEGFAGFVNR